MKEGWNQNIDSNKTAECPSLALFCLLFFVENNQFDSLILSEIFFVKILNCYE